MNQKKNIVTQKNDETVFIWMNRPTRQQALEDRLPPGFTARPRKPRRKPVLLRLSRQSFGIPSKVIFVALFAFGLFSLLSEKLLVSAQQRIEFTRDIQPLFDAHCISCHGAKKAAGQLRLDNKAAAMKGGISGAVIVPNNSKTSILLARVIGSDGQARMPMGDDPLKPEQLELLRQWIDAGAVWAADEKDSALSTQHYQHIGPTKSRFAPPFPPSKTKRGCAIR